MAGGPKFTSLGSSLADLEDARRDRLADAEALSEAKRYASAIAMGIYDLEIHLKVRICRKLDLRSLPRAFEIHDLDGLLLLAGLTRRMSGKSARLVKRNWGDITQFADRLSELRYSSSKGWSQEQATAFLELLKNPDDGALAWLSKQR